MTVELHSRQMGETGLSEAGRIGLERVPCLCLH